MGRRGLAVLVAVAMVMPLVAVGRPAAAASPGGFIPSRSRVASPQPRLATSLRDDLAAGAPVEPVSAAGRRPAGAPSLDVRVVIEARSAADGLEAVTAVGGVVTSMLQTTLEADVPAPALGRLADDPKVLHVREPRRMRPSSISEGVVGAGADPWQQSGWSGGGVKVAVLDVGFQGYTTKLGGELPLTVETDFGRCGDPFSTGHGTGVAEVVHDMAPGAQLRLVCIEDDVDFVAALSTFQANGVHVVNASIGNDLVGRGDGSGGPDTPAGAVAALRQKGILFVTSAGNSGNRHFHTSAVGGNGTTDPVRLTARGTFDVTVAGGTTAWLAMRWDAWPRTNLDFDVYIGNTTCGQVGVSDNDQAGAPGGLEPVEEVVFTNCAGEAQTFQVYVDRFKGEGSPRLDLFFGGVSAIEQTTPGSVSDPAASPAALAVGAECQGAVKPYSSRGPTIDERVKPDLVARDAVSNSVYGGAFGCEWGFTGTSASSPHVAGAAALLLEANPGLEPAEVQLLLEDWANDLAAPGKDSDAGAGQLRLRDPDAARTPVPQPFSPVSPVRLFDSRPGPLGAAEGEFGPVGRTTPVAGGTEVAVRVADVAGVPSNATAVVLNVTATESTGPSYLTVYPGGSRPNTSNVNFGPQSVVATHVTATVGGDQRVRLYNATGEAHVIVDIAGWYGPTGPVGVAPGRFTPRSAPARAFDSRSGPGYAEVAADRTTRLGPGEDVAIQVAGLGGVPPTAKGVVVNVTVTDPSSVGYLTVYPAGKPRPLASNLNWSPTQTVANLVVGAVGDGGAISVYSSDGHTHLIVDVIGWFEPGSGAGYVALNAPVRHLDTRLGNGPRLGPLGSSETHDLQVGAHYGVPSDAAAVMLSVIAVNPTSGGWLTVHPAGPRPLASNLNFVPGAIVPNAVVAGIGTAGEVSFFNSSGDTHVVSDLAGYYLDPARQTHPLDEPGGAPLPPPPTPPAPFPFWQPPADVLAGSENAFYVESDPGDYIGQGGTYRYSRVDTSFFVSTQWAALNVRLFGDYSWDATFHPVGALQVGDVQNVGRHPFASPGMDVSASNRGCNSLKGRFIVDQVRYVDGALNEVAIRFEQHCEGHAPALRGFFRWDADAPTAPPAPAASVGLRLAAARRPGRGGGYAPLPRVRRRRLRRAGDHHPGREG